MAKEIAALLGGKMPETHLRKSNSATIFFCIVESATLVLYERKDPFTLLRKIKTEPETRGLPKRGFQSMPRMTAQHPLGVDMVFSLTAFCTATSQLQERNLKIPFFSWKMRKWP